MIANFYIIPQSFKNEIMSNENFFSSLDSFIGDYHNLVAHKEDNKIYIQEDVFQIELPNGYNLGQFIYASDLELEGKEKSIRQFLSNIFLKLPRTQISIEDLKSKIKNNSLESCTGIISLFKIEDIASENQIVYDTNSWYSFRRYHLGIFFGNVNYFIDECIKYFPKIFFHKNNYSSTGKILNGFASKIVSHLEALNDVLPVIMIKEKFANHTDLLERFSTIAKLDETATVEGKKKTRLKFNFENEEGKFETLICEPHLKLSTNDKGDSKYFKNRIYFHFGKSNVQDSKILVAHIGEHL
ncbi:hypothetical protein WNY78_18725 [Psychroserpens sp. AS72]|uniref:hypothetical protein n=1 Tax=Psychroserpens sp. AS72 TaxID=3135775 RepID=UPI003173BBF8